MSCHKYTIDRIEENLAILLLRQDETVRYDIPLEQLPPEVTEGDILLACIEKGKVISVTVLEMEKANQQEKIKRKIQNLIDRNKQG